MIKRTCDVCGKEIREEDGNYGRGFFFVNAVSRPSCGLKLRVHIESVDGEYRMERDVCIACIEDCLNNGDVSEPVVDTGVVTDTPESILGPRVRPGREAFQEYINHFDCVVRK